MKYEIEGGVKEHNFLCIIRSSFTSLRSCKRYCPYYSLECWKKEVMRDLKTDCHLENEINVADYVACPNCGKKRIAGCSNDRYLCPDCGCSFSLDDDERREIMGDEFIEFDEKEIERQLSEIQK